MPAGPGRGHARGITDSPYRVPLEQLEQERVLRTDQVVLHGDGRGPPPAGLLGLPAGDGPAGDCDGD